MKKFNIAKSNNALFNASITPGCIFGEYTQSLGNKKAAIRYVWIVRDYSHVPMNVEVLKRGAKSWRTYRLPDKSAGDALKGLIGKILRYIEKFADDLPENMCGEISTYGNTDAPKSRKAQCLSESVYEGKYSPYAFNGSYGSDKHAFDNGLGTIRPEFYDKRDTFRNIVFANENVDKTKLYKDEVRKYDIELDSITYIMHDGSKYYYRD